MAKKKAAKRKQRIRKRKRELKVKKGSDGKIEVLIKNADRKNSKGK